MNTAIEAGEMNAIVPIDLVHRAITSGATIDVLEKLMALQERWEANQARKSFAAAIAAAKAEMPEILKTRRVDFRSTRGHTQYSYEDFAEIAATIAPALGKYGLSYRFRTTSTSPDHIAVTCIISHRDGYSEETTLPGSPDNSGNKNSMQAIGSAVTYLQRYTLKAALGLAVSADDDAQAAKPPPQMRAKPADATNPAPAASSPAAPAGPIEVKRADDSARAWSEWATTLMGYIRLAPDPDTINEWTVRNADQLEALKAHDAEKFQRLIDMISHQIEVRNEAGP